MPAQIGNWRRLSTESAYLQKIETLGVFSQIWHYQKGDTIAEVALDYPFCGYHDVTICYTARGWTMQEMLTRGHTGNPSAIPLAEVQMQDTVGLKGSLWFSTVDEKGNWIETPELKTSFLERWKQPVKTEPTTYRVQLLVTSYNPLPAADKDDAARLFDESRKLLWQQLSAQMKGR
jgi:hypothetical protein